MKFKGKSFIAIVLSPEAPFADWLKEIDRIIARSPGFFIDRPIILDVRGSKIPIEELEQLLSELNGRSIRVMGIDGVAGTRLKTRHAAEFFRRSAGIRHRRAQSLSRQFLSRRR